MEGFDQIYAEYFSEVYRFSLSLCRDPSLAEEITQEAFFKALKNIDRFRGEAKIGSWLCRIAKNTFYDHLKKQQRHGEELSKALISEESIEQKIADKETAFEVVRALHRLKEPYREVFWLRTFGELSFSQIGVLFEKTESWARVTYYRAKIMIKEEL